MPLPSLDDRHLGSRRASELAAESDALPVAPPAAAPCANCGAQRAGEYCCRCGQHFLEDRLTFRLLARELLERVTFERGLLRTVREMTTRPGHVVRAYLAGRRRTYASPLTYLFVGAAVSYAGWRLHDEMVRAHTRAQVEQAVAGPNPVLTAAQLERYFEVFFGVMTQFTWLGLAACVPFALLLRLLFRRQGINLLEAAVFTLFVSGHGFLLFTPVGHLTLVATGNFDLYAALSFVVMATIAALAATQYFGRTVRSALKAVAAYGLSTLLLSAAIVTGSVAYVMATVK